MLGRVHFIADHRRGRAPAAVLDLVSAAIAGGVRCVQVRSKDCPDGERYELAAAVVALCHEAGATCVVNDRVDIALAAAADGAHVGEEDMPVAQARRLLGPLAVLGASAREAHVAARAVAAGATYVGVGPCYPTLSKAGLPAPIGADGIASVVEAVDVPVIAIGGIDAGRAAELVAAGAYGVAVIAAIAAARDPAGAARTLVEVVEAAAERSGQAGPGTLPGVKGVGL